MLGRPESRGGLHYTALVEVVANARDGASPPADELAAMVVATLVPAWVRGADQSADRTSAGVNRGNMLLPIHIAAGGLAMVLGFMALFARKGGTIHRRSGLLFVYAMLVMGISASILGFRNSPADGNVMAGLMTAYFVGPALTTVRPSSPWTNRINATALTIAVGLALLAIVGGVRAVNSPLISPGGVPFRTIGVMSFILATVLLLAAAGDVRIMRFGLPRGGPRLARHLWRMCFALFIAAGSFFSIRERVAAILPEPFTTGPMRALPFVLLFGAMFYWLWRVRGRRPLPVLVRHDSAPLATHAK
jgi:hypothetical protein